MIELKDCTATIIVNFSLDGYLGCDVGCTYCVWRNHELSKKWIGPSKKCVSRFIDDFGMNCQNNMIRINGGGDPLFNFDDNVEYLLSVISEVMSKGFKVRLHTAKIGVATDNLSTLREYVAEWKFSIQHIQRKNLVCLREFNNPDISRVINANSEEAEIESYCTFYGSSVRSITLGGDYLDGSIDNAFYEKLALRIDRSLPCIVRYTPNYFYEPNKIFLVNNRVYYRSILDPTLKVLLKEYN